MRTVRACLAATAAVAVLGFGCLALTSASVATAGDAQVGAPIKVDNFRLTDQNLLSHELRRMADDKAVVIVTQQDGCKANHASAAALKTLKDAYAAKGVEFFMLNASLTDRREDIQAEAAAHGYAMPVLLDRYQLVGEQLGVTRAAEVIVIDPKTWKIAYRGPAADPDTTAKALDALAAGLPVTAPSQAAMGCRIDFPNRDKLAQANISYVREVAPIIEDKCAACHEKGGIGPMPLTSYEQVKSASPMIREVIRTQRMPPWAADPTVGHFLRDKSLTADQTRTLVHWIEAGAPRGEGADPLSAKTFTATEWPLGKPDLVLDIPAFNIPASGVVNYQHPFTANPLTKGEWLRASTIKVENRAAVHHVLTGYITDPPKAGTQAFENSWGASVGTYAVGMESTIEPSNTGVYLPPGGAVGFQNHYTPYGQAVTEHTKMAFYFYKDAPELVMHTGVLSNQNISIPPGQESWEQRTYVTFPKEALLFAVFPHAHYRGASSQLWLQTADGKKTLLIALPHYNFTWQRDYDFAQPIHIPAGARLIAVYTYDNSKRNPANPNPARTVPWGEQSFDEMLYTQIRYRWVGETSDKPNTYDDDLQAAGFFGMLDTDMDGRIEKSELVGPIGAVAKAHFDEIDTNHDGVIDAAELGVFVKKMMHRPAPAKVASN